MTCAKCGAKVEKNAASCPRCGAPTAGKEPAASTPVSVPNHMVGAILTTLFCCLIGGIISLVYASKVNPRLAQGDIDGAKAASKTAKLWIIISVVSSLLFTLIGVFGILLGAILPAVNNSMSNANAAAAAIKGRNLFVGIIQSSTDREAQGLPSVWPRTPDSDDFSDDDKDIAGKSFGSSTEYFNALFDIASRGRPDWAPYVTVDVDAITLSKNDASCGWIVAADVRPEFDDVIPVLVSANVDPSYLKTSFDGYDNRRIPFGSKVGRTKLPWCDKFVIVVRKGGASQIFKAKDFTYSNLYNRHPFSAPGLKYLDVR